MKKHNNRNEGADRLARAAKLAKNAEKVKTVDPDSNKGLAVKLASACPDNNPKKRTKNVTGGPTE